MTPPPTPETQRAAPRRRIGRRHVLMLVLAAEILVVGAVHAGRDRRPGIVVDQTLIQGHVIT